MIFFYFFRRVSLQITLDDSTIYSCDKVMNTIMALLNHDFVILSVWFYKNVTVLNLDKCS